jgi:hypothetical protein
MEVIRQDVFTEEPDGGNLLVRFWRGAGIGNLSACSIVKFTKGRESGRSIFIRV